MLEECKVEKLQKKMIQHQIIHYKDDLNFMFDDIINAEILIRKLKLRIIQIQE